MTGKVNAIVSGQSGVAILAHAEGLASLHAGRGTEVVRRSPSEARLLLGDAQDLQALENVELEEVSRRLDFATAQMDALHVALLLLDGSLSSDTRQEAAAELQELMEGKPVIFFVESVLFAHPLPADADLPGAFAACSQEEMEQTRSFLQRLTSLQDQITEVHQAWKRIPESIFGTEEDRGSVHSVAVREGLFRELVFCRADQVSVEKLLADFLLRSKIRREILLAWGVTLGNLPPPPNELYPLHYRSYGRILSEQDGEDIISEALQEEMSSILNRDLSAEEVSIPLARALNRNRARLTRKTFAAMPEVIDPATREDPILAIYYKETARKLRGYIGQAVDRLKTPYRDSIIEQYSLSRFGFQKQGVSPEPSSENARKVARFRARKAFWTELDMLLRQAETEGEDSDLIRGVRVLIQSRGLAAPVSRKPPRAEEACAPESPEQGHKGLQGRQRQQEQEKELIGALLSL
ncbi:MAG: hypothetical protein ACJ76Y_30175 [Thermoanaerobaculia bacterium]